MYRMPSPHAIIWKQLLIVLLAIINIQAFAAKNTRSVMISGEFSLKFAQTQETITGWLKKTQLTPKTRIKTRQNEYELTLEVDHTQKKTWFLRYTVFKKGVKRQDILTGIFKISHAGYAHIISGSESRNVTLDMELKIEPNRKSQKRRKKKKKAKFQLTNASSF